MSPTKWAEGESEVQTLGKNQKEILKVEEDRDRTCDDNSDKGLNEESGIWERERNQPD